MHSTKIKVSHAKSKQAFKAKGGVLWTVRMTDEEGAELPTLEDVSTEICLHELQTFLKRFVVGGEHERQTARTHKVPRVPDKATIKSPTRRTKKVAAIERAE